MDVVGEGEESGEKRLRLKEKRESARIGSKRRCS